MLEHPWLKDLAEVRTKMTDDIDCVKQQLFIVKSGNIIPYKQLEELTNAILVVSSCDSTEDRESFQELYELYGSECIHTYIRQYLTEMSTKNFKKFQERIDNDFFYIESKDK